MKDQIAQVYLSVVSSDNDYKSTHNVDLVTMAVLTKKIEEYFYGA